MMLIFIVEGWNIVECNSYLYAIFIDKAIHTMYGKPYIWFELVITKRKYSLKPKYNDQIHNAFCSMHGIIVKFISYAKL